VKITTWLPQLLALWLPELAVLPDAANAAPITLHFSGQLTSVSTDSPYPVGTPFQGSVTYRSDAAPTSVAGEMAATYLLDDPQDALSFSLGATQLSAVLTSPPDLAQLTLSVYDDEFTSCDAVPWPCLPVPPYDAYEFSYAEHQLTVLELSFRSSPLAGDLSAIESLELPTTADQLARLPGSVYYRDPIGEWIVDGRIDAIAVIPEPSTLSLCGLALAGLAAGRRAAHRRGLAG